MLLRHMGLCVLCYFFYLSRNVSASKSSRFLTAAKGQQLLEKVLNLTDALIEVTPYLNSSLTEIPTKCVQMYLCKFVCFNGIATDIALDISMAAQKINYSCSHLEELRLYNYEFTEQKLSSGFLGNYSNKVKELYIGSSYIINIEAGAFAKGIFEGIYFENLQLRELRKDFFNDISQYFSTLSIIQKQMPIEIVNADFLCNVRYIIKSLTLQAGLKSMQNLTGGEFLLNNLAHIDFSHNDFGNSMNTEAFSKVSVVQWLDLSDSRLEYLPGYIFKGFINTLQYLDLSHNKLKIIEWAIFGTWNIPRGLKVYAEGNEWQCSCELQRQIKFLDLRYRTALTCSGPYKYKGLSVFDDRICGVSSENLGPRWETTEKNADEKTHSTSATVSEQTTIAELQLNSTSSSLSRPDYVMPQNYMKMACLAKILGRLGTTSDFMSQPIILFNLVARNSLQVEVIIDFSEKRQNAYALVWFKKVTTKYHQMDLDLGYYKNITTVNSIKNLTANTAYTFCIVFRRQLTAFPYNCKSIYVSQSWEIKSAAWLTRDSKIAGLTLCIFGILVFLLAGILMIYLLFKHRPALFRSSQRANTFKAGKHAMTTVMPKRQPERQTKLASYTSSCNIFPKRRNSTDSEASYESYMNANVYEVIPAFVASKKQTAIKCSVDQRTLADINNEEAASFYLTPLASIPSTRNCSQYADRPRNSTVVLPQLPRDKHDYIRIENISFLDSHV